MEVSPEILEEMFKGADPIRCRIIEHSRHGTDKGSIKMARELIIYKPGGRRTHEYAFLVKLDGPGPDRWFLAHNVELLSDDDSNRQTGMVQPTTHDYGLDALYDSRSSAVSQPRRSPEHRDPPIQRDPAS